MSMNVDPPRNLFPKKAIRDIIRQEADKHGLTYEEILGRSQSQRIAIARQRAMYRARVEVGKSLPFIGKMFNRNHTTVLHSISKIEAMEAGNAETSPRTAAFILGNLTYMGSPCVHGHDGERRTKSGK